MPTPWWMDPRARGQYGRQAAPPAQPPPPVTAAPDQGAPGQPPPPRSLLDLLGGGQTGGANPITPQQSMAMGRAGLNMMGGQMPGQPQQPGQAPGSSPGQAVNPELAMMGMQRPFWMNNLQQLTGGNPNTAAQLGFPLPYGLGGGQR